MESGKSHYQWDAIGDPTFSAETPRIFIGDPNEKQWGLQCKSGISDEKVGVFNENLGISNKNLRVFVKNLGVPLQW